MALVTTKQMLLDAQKGGYAVGAFNVENMEMVQATIEAAEELKSPVILQATPLSQEYTSSELIYAMVEVAAKNASVPIAIHLDHGSSFEWALKCLRAGFTSIMIDGSHRTFEENITICKKVVEICHLVGIPVEAELGKVGGNEDGLESGENNPYTDPKQAAELVERTGVDSLAVAIGTAHGVYKGVPKLDKNRLSEIREAVSVPLVLHGTSGVPDEDVKDCIARGICKVNYATDLRMAFTNGIRDAMTENPNLFDPKIYGALGREKVKERVKDRIRVVGSAGKA